MNTQAESVVTPDPPSPAPAATARVRTAQAIHARTAVGALLAGLRRGWHPQLLLAWVLVLMLPAVIAALPIAAWVQAQFAHSSQAPAIAQGRDGALIAAAWEQLQPQIAVLAGSSGVAMLLAIALAPWLTGMVVAQIRTVYRLRMGGVLRAGLGEYPRMLRMLLWSLVPIGSAVAIGLGVLAVAHQFEAQFSPTQTPVVSRLALWGMIALVLLAHISVEAGRAWLGADLAMQSVVRAWTHGMTLLVQRPTATLTVYLGTSLVGYGAAFALLQLRGWFDAGGTWGWLLALATTQLIVAALAWGRSARLHGLADIATAIVMQQAAAEEAQHAAASDASAATH